MARLTTIEDLEKNRSIEAEGIAIWRSDEVPEELLAMARAEQERQIAATEERKRKAAEEDERKRAECMEAWDQAMVELATYIPAEIREHIDPDPLIRKALDHWRKPGMYDFFVMEAPGMAPIHVFPWYLSPKLGRILYQIPHAELKDEAEYRLGDCLYAELSPDELPEPEEVIAVDWSFRQAQDTESAQKALYLAIHAEIERRAMLPQVERKRAEYAAKADQMKLDHAKAARKWDEIQAKRQEALAAEEKALAELADLGLEAAPWEPPITNGSNYTWGDLFGVLERIATALEAGHRI
jgi:hypothetical protein